MVRARPDSSVASAPEAPAEPASVRLTAASAPSAAAACCSAQLCLTAGSLQVLLSSEMFSCPFTVSRSSVPVRYPGQVSRYRLQAWDPSFGRGSLCSRRLPGAGPGGKIARGRYGAIQGVYERCKCESPAVKYRKEMRREQRVQHQTVPSARRAPSALALRGVSSFFAACADCDPRSALRCLWDAC